MPEMLRRNDNSRLTFLARHVGGWNYIYALPIPTIVCPRASSMPMPEMIALFAIGVFAAHKVFTPVNSATATAY